MLNNKKIIVVLPAYNAESTLEQTYREIPLDIVDEVLMVDDHSVDSTVSVAKKLGVKTILHERNYGYGRNQKTCYREALRRNADIVVMVHPDYQYTPKLIVAMASIIAFDVYDVVLGSRIIGGKALRGGMPIYKYIANRFLTAFQNLLIGSKLSEFHTGYRAFSRKVLEELPLSENDDDFVFDNEMLVQCIHFGYRIGEVSCPTRYFEGASSINFSGAVRYGIGVIGTSLKCLLHRLKIRRDPLFNSEGRKLGLNNGQNEKR
jgi:glycosyltransferase involved in cell wall biosynthesis